LACNGFFRVTFTLYLRWDFSGIDRTPISTGQL
jgi:hypothetical protein